MYSKTLNKLIQAQGTLRFLTACRAYGFIPNHIKHRTRKTGLGLMNEKVIADFKKVLEIFITNY